MRKTKKLSQQRRGGIMVMMLGVTVIIVFIAILFLEVSALYEAQYIIETRAQRALNSTVEYAMDDEWRKDGFNYMDVDVAQGVLYTNLNSDLNIGAVDAYSITVSNVRFYSGNPDDGPEPAGIELDLTVTMNVAGGLFRQTVTWTQHFKSTNFRTDDNLRAGIR